MFGLLVSSICAFLIAGPFLVLPGVFVFLDAWSAGIYKRPGVRGFLNLSPMGWAIAMQGLLIVAYPLYLAKRSTLRTRNGNVVLFFLVLVSGALPFLLIGLRVFYLYSKAQGHS